MSSNQDFPGNIAPPSLASVVPSPGAASLKSTQLLAEHVAPPDVASLERPLGVGASRLQTQDSSMVWLEAWLSGCISSDLLSSNKNILIQLIN